MRVVIGPVSSASAELWLDYAREVVDDLGSIAPGACFATPEIQSIFDRYVAEWQAEAASDGLFHWESEVPAEQIEYHVHAFHQLATALSERAEERGETLMPEGGREFYAAVLRGALGALEAENPASAAFAQHLGEFWPGEALSIR